MKSVPGAASLAPQTVARSMVLFMRSITAPSACFASLPVSMLMVRPSGRETVFVITFILYFYNGLFRRKCPHICVHKVLHNEGYPTLLYTLWQIYNFNLILRYFPALFFVSLLSILVYIEEILKVLSKFAFKMGVRTFNCSFKIKVYFTNFQAVLSKSKCNKILYLIWLSRVGLLLLPSNKYFSLVLDKD